MLNSKTKSLLMLQQVAHTVANGLLSGLKLCQDGTNAVMCQEIMLIDGDTSVE
jgi:hypothetical protein